MNSIAIRGATVVDSEGTRRADVLVGADGNIAEVAPTLRGSRNIDAGGCILCPGLVDLHAHLREPGHEQAETIASGAQTAALGGFTAVVTMPNTNPATDCVAVVGEIRALAEQVPCEIVPSAAITVGRLGEALSPMAELVRAGVRMFTDDGRGVQDEAMMRLACEYVMSLQHLCPNEPILLAQHCEVESLSKAGFMNEGRWSSQIGIAGQPALAEELMISRDIALSRLTGARIHFQHISTARSAGLVRSAKAEGLPITAEVTPHHLALTEASCATYDPIFKVHPPLRRTEDLAALKVALEDGTIDAIATDHAPHTEESKQMTFAAAPPGMIGLETAFAVANTHLDMPLEALIGAMSSKPAALVGLSASQGGPIKPGRPANLAVIDPDHKWTVKAKQMASRSSNSPYEGMTLKGKVRHTIFRGRAVVVDGALTE